MEQKESLRISSEFAVRAVDGWIDRTGELDRPFFSFYYKCTCKGVIMSLKAKAFDKQGTKRNLYFSITAK